MTGRRITETQKKKYAAARDDGYSIESASKIAGFSESTGHALEKQYRQTIPAVAAAIKRSEAKIGGPKSYEELCPEAKRALEDFSYFEQRYFGVIPHPWQKDCAENILRLLDTPEKEYSVINAPPGAGKTSLVTLRIASWLTCRDRSVRGMIGSATTKLAKNNVSQLRREFARVHPLQNPSDEVAKGLAYDAAATMSQDFGRFKPIDRDLWTSEAFTVEQLEARGPLSEKEPTWSAYGIDAEYTGLRYPLVLWDDLVSLANQNSADMRAKIERLWMSVCENRLEPGGLLVLLGQRLLPDDLYNFALSMQVPIDDEDAYDDEAQEMEMRQKYHHFIYKAHYEDKCVPGSGNHRRGGKPWPDGCLLVPERLTYRDILIAEAKPDYRTVYQQEDVNPDSTLIRREWIFGEGEWTGCLDKDRDQWEIPERTNGEFLSIVTADPSPSNYWAVEWWLYHPESDQRFLIALHRAKMEAPDFLEWRQADGFHSGLLEEWFDMSAALGHPFTHLVFEKNAAQKFFLQYDVFKTWRDRHGIEVIAHTTGANKADEDLGVWALQTPYKFGKVRLPYREGPGRARTLDFIKELTTYPYGKTDDCIMAHWFLEWNLPNIALPRVRQRKQKRPSWLGTGRAPWGGRSTVNV